MPTPDNYKQPVKQPSLEAWRDAPTWTAKSPMERVQHFAGGIDKITLSIATSLQNTSVQSVRDQAPGVCDKLWKMIPKQHSDKYMRYSNPEWTVALESHDGELLLLDLRRGIFLRPLEAADRHTAHLRLALPTNFEALVRSFPFDVLSTLDSYGVDKTRWSKEQETMIKAWCNKFPTEQQRTTAWRTITGRSNQFAKGAPAGT